MRRVLLVTAAALGLFLPASAHAQNPAEHYTITAGPAVLEGTSNGETQATFTITRSGFTGQTTSVEWATDPSGTATPDVDYRSDPGGLTFTSGQTTKTIQVQVRSDSTIEPDETFGVKLTDVTPSGNGSADHTVAYDTIIDDDGRPAGTHFDVSDAPTVTEGGQSVFTVTLSNAPTAPMSVRYDTVDGTANSGLDYSATSNVLTFDAGETSKTIAVQTLADHEQDPNETFQLRLSSSSAPSIGQATATATIDDDVTQSQKEHTLLGTLYYEPAFGIGFDGVESLGPFGAPLPPNSVTVTLRDGSGAPVATRDFTRKDTSDGNGFGPIPYRFDGLGACAGCSVVMTTPDGTVQDTAPVGFDGTPGQDNVDLYFGSQTTGGSVDGTVLAPLGGRANSFNVVIKDASGKVLADTNSSRLACGKGDGEGCPSSDSYNYHLIGLPTDPIPVTAVLNMVASGKGKFQVDSADFTLDPSGHTTAPDLTGIADPPAGVSGRTLYGQLNFLKPFAPGARSAKDLDIDSGGERGPTIELRDKDGKALQKLNKFTKTGTGYNGYEFHKLDACAACTVNVVDDKKVVATSKVVIPTPSPSVTRSDLSYSKAGAREFVAGSIRGGDTPARKVSVAVTDAATGAKLGDSGEGQQACAGGTRCPDGGTFLYRLAGIPADRDVILTLKLGGKAVDSRRLTTADANQVTQAPLLVIPYGKGPRSIQGHVLNAGPFTLGDTAVHWKQTTLVVRLVDANQQMVAEAAVQKSRPEISDRGDSFVIDNLQPCADCTLELLRSDGTVDDRVPVEVRDDNPSVTVADVGYGTFLGGAYVEGTIVLRKSSRLPRDTKVQVLDATGKVVADSTKVPANKKNNGEGAGAGFTGTKFDYRLGGIPRTAGALKLVVLQGKKKLASTTVTLAPGLADTHVQDLKVDFKQGADGR